MATALPLEAAGWQASMNNGFEGFASFVTNNN